MPTFIIVCSVLLLASLLAFAYWKPWFAGDMSAVGAFLWNYIL
jgi:hypothetical protein